LKSAGLYPDFGVFPRSEEKRLPRPFPSRHQEASKGILRHEMPVQNRYTIQPNIGARPGGRGLAESGRWKWGYFGPPTLKSAENAATAVHFPSRRDLPRRATVGGDSTCAFGFDGEGFRERSASTPKSPTLCPAAT
jgi:hypothetical protein